MADEQVQTGDLTAGERDALDIFQQRLVKLNDLEEQRAAQGRLYKEQQFGTKVDRAAAAKPLSRMHLLDEQIQKASADVLTVEDKAVLKNVLKKACKVVEKQQFEHDQETLQRWRKRRNDGQQAADARREQTMTIDFLTEFSVPIIVGICLCAGYILKNLVPTDRINRFIPLLMGAAGAALNCWVKLASPRRSSWAACSPAWPPPACTSCSSSSLTPIDIALI